MVSKQGYLKPSWHKSLKLKLSIVLSAVVLLLAGIASIYTFHSTYADISTLLDTQLKQVADIVTPYSKILHTNNDIADINFNEDSPILPEPKLLVQDISSRKINDIFQDKSARSVFTKITDGLHNIQFATRSWRVYIRRYNRHHRIVVAQRSAYREKIAQEVAWRTVLPWVISIPILWVMIALTVQGAFRHFNRAARELDLRSDDDLRPLYGNKFPSESYVFINAINQLLARLNTSFDDYRRFIGDAAHELRTPITALSLQAACLDEEGISQPELNKRIHALQQGVLRMQNLLSDLLTLARIQNRRKDIDLPSDPLIILRYTIEELMPIAQEKNIDLGVGLQNNMSLMVDEIALRAVFKNLIENAIQHTPTGSRVDIDLWQEKGYLKFRVSDSGHGVTKADQARIFEPFYRGHQVQCEGSGLGLAIVQGVCRQYHAQIQLGEAVFDGQNMAMGFSITISFKLP